MARVKLSPDLKKAISALSHKEKDKLLFRLLPKEEMLVAQLEFQLLEDAATVAYRRDGMRERIERGLQKSSNFYYSPGYLLLDLRSISGEINRHVKTTKDKYGEVELNLYMLRRSMELFGGHLQFAGRWQSRTLNEYMAKRILKLLSLLEKLPEDYHGDFRDDFQLLGTLLQKQSHFLRVADRLGLDVSILTDV